MGIESADGGREGRREGERERKKEREREDQLTQRGSGASLTIFGPHIENVILPLLTRDLL